MKICTELTSGSQSIKSTIDFDANNEKDIQYASRYSIFILDRDPRDEALLTRQKKMSDYAQELTDELLADIEKRVAKEH